MKRLKYPEDDKVILLKSDANYTEFHLNDGTTYVSSFTLKLHVENHKNFLRVNRGCLLNPDFIKKVHSVGLERKVELFNGRFIKVSRRRRNVINEFTPNS